MGLLMEKRKKFPCNRILEQYVGQGSGVHFGQYDAVSLRKSF
jgi:hypothetical protein